MILLSAKPVAETIRRSIRAHVTEFKSQTGRAPKLSVLLVGDDPASVIYTTKKGTSATEIGFDHETVKLPAGSTPNEVRTIADRLNRDEAVDGILIQRPLPGSFDESDVVYWIDPRKDVDGFHPDNTGRLHIGLPCLIPCTPHGIIRILRHYLIEMEGKTACIIGRSSIVGKPVASLLLKENATVIHCHSKTRDLSMLTRQADILVVAAGKPKLIEACHVKPGATVIDVGIHRMQDGRMCGDVDFESVAQVAGALTPVPGGVGPMTITMLLANTLLAAQQRVLKSGHIAI